MLYIVCVHGVASQPLCINVSQRLYYVLGYCEQWMLAMSARACVYVYSMCVLQRVCACRMQCPLPRHPRQSPETFSAPSSPPSPQSAQTENKMPLNQLHQTPRMLLSVTSLVTRSGTSLEAACRAWARSQGLFCLRVDHTLLTSPPPSHL